MLPAFLQKLSGKETKRLMISRGVYQKLMNVHQQTIKILDKLKAETVTNVTIPLSDDKSVVLFKRCGVATVSIEQCVSDVDQTVWGVQFTPKESATMGGKKLKAGIMAELAEIGGDRVPIAGEKGMIPVYRYINITATTDMNVVSWCLSGKHVTKEIEAQDLLNSAYVQERGVIKPTCAEIKSAVAAHYVLKMSPEETLTDEFAINTVLSDIPEGHIMGLYGRFLGELGFDEIDHKVCNTVSMLILYIYIIYIL